MENSHRPRQGCVLLETPDLQLHELEPEDTQLSFKPI